MNTAAASPQPNPAHNNFIPPAVRKAAEEAERLHRELNQTGDKPADPPPAPTNPEPSKSEPPTPTNPEPAKPEPAKPEPAKPEQKTGAEDWEQRFRSEQGRAQRLREDVRMLSEQVSSLQSLLSTVQAPPPAEMKFEAPSLLTPEEKAEWGEILPVIEKRAQELIAPLQAQLEARLKELDGRIDGTAKTVQATNKQQFLHDLTTAVPDWQRINEDPAFVEWVDAVDELSGQTRHDMVMQAWNSMNASRVAAFFKRFLDEARAVAPQPAPSPTTPATPARSLESLAAPGRGHPGTPPSNGGGAEKPIISRADIIRFYADKTAGRWKGREAEADAYEKQIFQAQNEGRIT